MGAAIGSQQACPRSDVRAGQFEIAASLAGLRAASAAIDMAAIAMPFEFWLGNVGDDVIFKVLGGFEIVATAMGALFGVDIVFDADGVRRRFGPKRAGMFAMFFATTVVGCALPRRAAFAAAFAALQELLDLVFQLRNPFAQLGVFRFEFSNPLVAWIIHDRGILTKIAD